jgi:hypothetical protein
MYSYVKSVNNQVMNGNAKGGSGALEQKAYAEKVEKKKKSEADALLASLFKNAQMMAGVEEITSNK